MAQWRNVAALMGLLYVVHGTGCMRAAASQSLPTAKGGSARFSIEKKSNGADVFHVRDNVSSVTGMLDCASSETVYRGNLLDAASNPTDQAVCFNSGLPGEFSVTEAGTFRWPVQDIPVSYVDKYGTLQHGLVRIEAGAAPLAKMKLSSDDRAAIYGLPGVNFVPTESAPAAPTAQPQAAAQPTAPKQEAPTQVAPPAPPAKSPEPAKQPVAPVAKPAEAPKPAAPAAPEASEPDLEIPMPSPPKKDPSTSNDAIDTAKALEGATALKTTDSGMERRGSATGVAVSTAPTAQPMPSAEEKKISGDKRDVALSVRPEEDPRIQKIMDLKGKLSALMRTKSPREILENLEKLGPATPRNMDYTRKVACDDAIIALHLIMLDEQPKLDTTKPDMDSLLSAAEFWREGHKDKTDQPYKDMKTALAKLGKGCTGEPIYLDPADKPKNRPPAPTDSALGQKRQALEACARNLVGYLPKMADQGAALEAGVVMVQATNPNAPPLTPAGCYKAVYGGYSMAIGYFGQSAFGRDGPWVSSMDNFLKSAACVNGPLTGARLNAVADIVSQVPVSSNGPSPGGPTAQDLRVIAEKCPTTALAP